MFGVAVNHYTIGHGKGSALKLITDIGDLGNTIVKGHGALFFGLGKLCKHISSTDGKHNLTVNKILHYRFIIHNIGLDGKELVQRLINCQTINGLLVVNVHGFFLISHVTANDHIIAHEPVIVENIGNIPFHDTFYTLRHIEGIRNV